MSIHTNMSVCAFAVARLVPIREVIAIVGRASISSLDISVITLQLIYWQPVPLCKGDESHHFNGKTFMHYRFLKEVNKSRQILIKLSGLWIHEMAGAWPSNDFSLWCYIPPWRGLWKKEEIWVPASYQILVSLLEACCHPTSSKKQGPKCPLVLSQVSGRDLNIDFSDLKTYFQQFSNKKIAINSGLIWSINSNSI